MADPATKELAAKAADYASRDIDLYDLVGLEDVTAQDPKAIQRAWRKSSLKHHPDKAGANFDPDKWELLENARDILLDATARSTYDNGRAAKLRRQAERNRVQGERKRFIDQLEADELEAKRRKNEEAERARELEREKMRLREEGMRRMAEEAERFKQEQLERQQRKAAEAEAESDEDDDPRIREIKRKLEENKRRRAEKKAKRRGGRSAGEEIDGDGVDGAQPPDGPDSAAMVEEEKPARPPPNLGDLKARMFAMQKKRDAAKLAKQQEAEEAAAAAAAAAEAQ